MSALTRTVRTRSACALVAGGFVTLSLALVPAATADTDDPGAARNDIGQLQRADPGAARNDIGTTPQVDVRRLLNDIDDPAVAPRPEPVPVPATVPVTDSGVTADDSNPYVGLALGALAGVGLGAGVTAAVAVRRSHTHAAGQAA
jgi:hypothetical protein